jgi:hypothetical protein
MDIELGDAVAALRDELLDAADRATTADVEFSVGPIELEFAVELRFDAKAKTGFKAWVVSADAEAGISRTTKHTVSITLTPPPARWRRSPGIPQRPRPERAWRDRANRALTDRGPAWNTHAS